MCVLELVPLRGWEISSHAHKTRSWYLLGILFKIPDDHPRPFYMWVLPRISNSGKYSNTTTFEQDPPNHKIVGGVYLHAPCLTSKDGVFNLLHSHPSIQQ